MKNRIQSALTGRTNGDRIVERRSDKAHSACGEIRGCSRDARTTTSRPSSSRRSNQAPSKKTRAAGDECFRSTGPNQGTRRLLRRGPFGEGETVNLSVVANIDRKPGVEENDGEWRDEWQASFRAVSRMPLGQRGEVRAVCAAERRSREFATEFSPTPMNAHRATSGSSRKHFSTAPCKGSRCGFDAFSLAAAEPEGFRRRDNRSRPCDARRLRPQSTRVKCKCQGTSLAPVALLIFGVGIWRLYLRRRGGLR